jgi:hypothetical protein
MEREDCQSDIEECNTSCLYGSIDFFESCYGVCRGIECPACSEGESGCVAYGYSFSVTGRADPRIEAACERAVERDNACHESNVDPRCSHYAKLERPEARTAYDCIAKTACGELLEPCNRSLSRRLGTTLCAGAGDDCTELPCDPEFAAEFNEATRWLDDDVYAMGAACLDEPCGRRLSCLTAWVAAVFP